jgi:hypothetical protein
MFETVRQFIEREADGEWDDDREKIFLLREFKRLLAGQFFYDYTLYLVSLIEYQLQDDPSIDFRSFMEEIRTRPHPHVECASEILSTLPLKVAESKLEGNGAPLKEEDIPDITPFLGFLFDEDDILKNIKAILTICSHGETGISINWQHPPTHMEFHRHLWALFVYYCVTVGTIPLLTDQKMDIALCLYSKTIGVADIRADVFAKDKYRTQKARKTTSKKIERRRKEILRLFNNIDTRGRTPHNIASLIQQEMEKIMQEPPSVKTIRRDLRELGLC